MDSVFQIDVGCGHDPHVDCHLLGATQTVVRHAIEHPQQFDLRLGVEFADLIQEQSTCRCSFEQTGFQGVGAAECAFFVAEQLTLNQMLGQSATVEIHPGLGTAEGVMMDCAGDQFLAAAAFTSNQHCGVGLCHFNHQLHQLLHRLACDDGGKTEI